MTICTRLKTALALCCLLVILQGCVPRVADVEKKTEPDIKAETVTNVVGMTKKELIARFGPPLAVARQDGTPIYIPKPYKEGSEKIEPDQFLDKFRPQYSIDAHYIVYYYQKSNLRGTGVLLIGTPTSLPVMFGKNITVYKFWVLIDERTQKVVDYRTGESE